MNVFPPVLSLSVTFYGTEYPFSQFRSAVPAAFPPNLLAAVGGE